MCSSDLEQAATATPAPAQQAAPAPTKEVTTESARRGEFKLKSGEMARVVEGANRGQFSVQVGSASGKNMESMGQFQMDDQFSVSRIESRANWAMDNVRDAAQQFAVSQREATAPAPAAPAPAPAAVGAVDKDGNTIVGRRADGVMIRKDKNGVRWYASEGEIGRAHV